MAIKPTRFSRVSVGWRDSVNSIVDKDPADTGAAFSVTGATAVSDLTATGRTALGVNSGKSAADVGIPGEIVISGTHLYVADSSGSFRVVDTSELSQ